VGWNYGWKLNRIENDHSYYLNVNRIVVEEMSDMYGRFLLFKRYKWWLRFDCVCGVSVGLGIE